MVEGNTIDEGGFFAAIYFYNSENLKIIFFMKLIKFYLFFSQKYIKISCPQDLFVLFLGDVVYLSLIFNPFCSVFVKTLKKPY